MNKIILILGGVIVIVVAITILMFTSFFKSPTPTSTNFTSPLYNVMYSNVIYPNIMLTPGKIATNDLNLICNYYYSELLVEVPDEITKEVYKEYKIESYEPKEYEIDHWIPLALGGSNNIENLWPQPVTSPGYKEKDYTHMYLRDKVCNDEMTLTEARNKITGDWYSLYLEIKGN